MFPLVKTLPSYIKDTKYALQIFDQMHFSGPHNLIFTMDVMNMSSIMYTCGFREIHWFHPALKFTWEISESCVLFLDISVSINGDALTTMRSRFL